MSPGPRRTRGRPSLAKKKTIDRDTEIADSDDLSFNNEIVSDVPKVPSPTGNKVFKAVAIPIMRPIDASPRDRQAPSHSPSGSSSAFSRYRENSNEDDTPCTSAAVTPAECSIEGRKTNLLSEGMTNNLLSDSKRRGVGIPSSSRDKGKRKRAKEDEMDEQIIDDALLAQSLQEQEYAESDAQPSVPKKRGRRSKVLVSEDEFNDTVEFSSQVNDDLFSRRSSIQHDREKLKRVKTVGSTSLPSHAARDSARKSIAEKASIGIMDSDEEELSDMSIYESDLDSELEYSDIDDDDTVDPRDLATAAEITAAPETLPNPSRRRRRRAALSNSPDAARGSRRFPWLSSRVRPVDFVTSPRHTNFF